ncbi:hypothetical protein [Acinetobacter sp. P8-3-8]|uniref:hypothetical protein n=1 Tax=Acinetobacter sp. P8-3-8 TaxID=1029823 RepID=UPI0002487B0B|nr:hypothetical protein [Acinetobacter sp. P8-3-8]
MMKLLKISTTIFVATLSMHTFADPVEDQFKDLIAPQSTYAKFQKNFDTILGEIETIAERGNRTQDKAELYPMCVAMQSAITALKNNKKFKTDYDKDYKQFNTTYNETLANATHGLSGKKEICEEGKQYYFEHVLVS